MGDIGKAIKAVSKDPPKMPDDVQQRIQQAAENPQKLVGEASQALAGADATKAADAAEGAAQSAPKMPDAVQQRIQQAAENPQDLVGEVSQALAGADANEGVAIVKDAAKEGAAIVKGSTWQDLSSTVRRNDVKNTITNPERAVGNVGKSKFLSSTDEQDGVGVGGARLVALAVLAGLVLGAYALLRHLWKPRSAGWGMLSGDHEQGSVAAARSWMGTSARDVVPNSPGGTSQRFSGF